MKVRRKQTENSTLTTNAFEFAKGLEKAEITESIPIPTSVRNHIFIKKTQTADEIAEMKKTTEIQKSKKLFN